MSENPKNIDFWENVLKNSPKSYQDWFREEKEYLTKTIDKDSAVLEVGCGDGRSIFDILEKTKDIVGIDHDETAVKHAKANFKDIPQIKIQLADAEDLPFENGSFDHVVCMTTFANFGQKKYKILEEMRRVLKDSGTIILSVFSEDALEERMKVYKSTGVKIKEIKPDGKITFDESVGDNVSEQFSKTELLGIFKKAALNPDDIKKVNMAYLCKLSKQKDGK
jgi:ubiquinone/menaquinone biosynthesis C-methylase UbiE